MRKIISWNVNGIRAVFRKGFTDFLLSEKPDILAVQETKAKPEQLESEIINPEGYTTVFASAQRPGYSGVAVYIKQNIDFKYDIGLNIKKFDDEGRTLFIYLDDLVFVNSYFPNSQTEGKRLDYKLAYCDAVMKHLDRLSLKGDSILLSGDYNIAHTEIDLANPKENTNSPGFLPEEREWIGKFLSSNYIDTFRLFNKGPDNYTWWSYRTKARERNSGWRIDYHCVNKILKDRVRESYHNTDVLGSDHCPVTIIID